MDNIQCSVNIDDDQKIIFLKGLSATPLSINFSSDVDFTELVSVLTSLIDNSRKIEIASFEPTSDEKLNLILETITSIIGKYNDSISDNEPPIQEVSALDDDLPF
jgi:hypothetical protein